MQLIIGKWHIQVSKYGKTNKERYYKLYTRRRNKGYCVQCGKRVIKKNKHTGLLLRKCDKCRLRENELANKRNNK